MIAPAQITETRILVDTDVFSYLFRRDTRADFFRPYLTHRTLAISFMSVGELYYGAYKDGWGAARIESLENHLKNFVVLPYDYLVCQQWGRVRAERRAKGREIRHADCWIAATALRHDCALATNNGKDFVEIAGLVVISPGLS